MKVTVPVENGLLPDKYGKYAPASDQMDGRSLVSFPMTIEGVPEGAKTLALVFIDWGAAPLIGFPWIHWVACNIPADIDEVPENASQSGAVPMAQGTNSEISVQAGSYTDPKLTHRYCGPYPPDKTHKYDLHVYALDDELDLQDGFFINELFDAMKGHILEESVTEMLSRS